MADRTDTFSGSTLGANWTTVPFTTFVGMRTLESPTWGYATGSSDDADNAAYWNADTWSDNLTVTLTLQQSGSSQNGVGPAIWKLGAGGYAVMWWSEAIHLCSVTAAGSFTEDLDTAYSWTPADGNTLTLQISGNDVIVLANGVEVQRATDTTYRGSLLPGMFSDQGSTGYLMADTWEATGLSGGAGSPISVAYTINGAQIV